MHTYKESIDKVLVWKYPPCTAVFLGLNSSFLDEADWKLEKSAKDSWPADGSTRSNKLGPVSTVEEVWLYKKKFHDWKTLIGENCIWTSENSNDYAKSYIVSYSIIFNMKMMQAHIKKSLMCLNTAVKLSLFCKG